VVVLSQYDDPEYAISLLADGAAGYAYLLKDSIAEGNQLARAVREVATGGSVLDPKIVEALVHPVAGIGGLTADEERLLQQVAEGRPIKAIAASQHTTPAAIAEAVEQLFVTLSKEASTGEGGSLRRLRHAASGDRRSRGAGPRRSAGSSRPASREDAHRGRSIGETEELVVTVIMSTSAATRASRRRPTRARSRISSTSTGPRLNRAILDEDGTVMQFVGDAVMGVLRRPVAQDEHADRAYTAAVSMIRAQVSLDVEWAARGLPPFGLGIGLSTGPVRRGVARVGGTARVHAGGRHGEPRATAAGPRPARRVSRVQRGDPGCTERGSRMRRSSASRRSRDPIHRSRVPRAGSRKIPPHGDAALSSRFHYRRNTMTDQSRIPLHAGGLRKSFESEGAPRARVARRRLRDAAGRVVAVMGPFGLREVDVAQTSVAGHRHADRRRDRARG
jgi:hypothetical protein